MGVTYAAYDAELDRNIAIKLVRSDRHTSSSAQARLRREAQALARIAHPNIVAVYDVGEYSGRVYIAMELVNGQTLLQWCRARQRSFADVLTVFRQAGAGLAAAHDAGLVHRDFKPSNVMVGDDNRVRVLDFGLVRFGIHTAHTTNGAHDGPPPDPKNGRQNDDHRGRGDHGGGGHGRGDHCGGDHNGDDRNRPAATAEVPGQSGGAAPKPSMLTIPGTIVGTPAYMAPEQFHGGDSDARSDQFSFAVSLYEALYGQRPFADNLQLPRNADKSSTTEAAIPADDVSSGGSIVVPSSIHAILIRALAYEPEARWSSMDEMLGELERAYRPWRWHWIAATVLGVGVGIAMSVGFAISTLGWGSGQERVCSGAERQLEGLWSESQQREIEAVFAATQLRHADEVWGRVRDGVAQYRTQWISAHTEACEATAVRHEQSEAVMDQRMLCLNERRQTLQGLTERLAEVDAKSLNIAVSAVSALPRISPCADIAYLSARTKPPIDPDTAARVHAVRADLLRVADLEQFGEYERADALLGRVGAQVEALEYLPLSAERHFRAASLLRRRGDFHTAKTYFEEAFFYARMSEHSEVGVLAAVELVFLHSHKLGLYDQARIWGRMARSELSHTSMPEAEVLLLRNEGILLENTGEVNAALDYYRRAVAKAEQVYPWGHPEIGRTLNSLGFGLVMAGRYRDGVDYLRRALHIYDRAWGGSHPTTTYISSALGSAMAMLGHYDEAEALLRGSIAKLEETWGSDHADISLPMGGLGRVLMMRGQAAEAEAAFERALRVRALHTGPGSPKLAELRMELADSVRAQAQYRRAEVLYRQVLQSMEESLPADAPGLSAPLVRLAELALDVHERRAVDVATEGDEYMDLSDALTWAERAFALLDPPSSNPYARARAHFALARALLANGQQKERARALAKQARAIYAGNPQLYADALRNIDDWLER